MARIPLNYGTTPGDGTGDKLYYIFKDVNDNFIELFNSVQPYVSKNSNYTAAITDWAIECTANSFTVLLPTAVGITGKVFNIKNTGSGTITVDGSGTETIDGSLTKALAQWDSVTIQSNGANWIIL